MTGVTQQLQSSTTLSHTAFLQQMLEREDIRAQIKKLVDEVKSEEGFLKALYNLRADPNPEQKIQASVEEFIKFCRENKAMYNPATDELERIKTLTDHVRQNKFLLAAVAGTLAGLGGVDPSNVEILNKTPGLFFAALPIMAVPFIAMNVFKSFSNREIVQEIGTFARFAGLMAAAIGIGFAATGIAGDALGTLDLARTHQETAQQVDMRSFMEMTQAAWAQFGQGNIDAGLAETTKLLKTYSIGDYLLHALGGSVALTVGYKMLKDKGVQAKGMLTRGFSKAGVWAGDRISDVSTYFDKAFMGFINVAGPVSIFTLLAITMSQGGAEDLKQYAGYYMTVLGAMGAAGAAILGSVLAYGKGMKGVGEVLGVKSKAFSLSSSGATMPFTKKALQRMGISDDIANVVVPTGATFNMGGTALYLGMTALCASIMLGHDPSAIEAVLIMSAAVGTAFAAPGIPASSIAFMAPVLNSVGLSTEEQAAVFAMILVVDRVFDMIQTSLNVGGDMVVAMDVEAGKDGKGVGGFMWRNGGEALTQSIRQRLGMASHKAEGPSPEA